MKALAGLALGLAASGALAHGSGPAPQPWVQGGAALFGDPASLMLLIALALLLAQAEPLRSRRVLQAGLAGLLLGALLALAGLAWDLTLPLLAFTLLLGVLVAWARPLPQPLQAALVLAAGGGVVLMLGPAVAEPLGFRLGWLLGVWAAVGLLFANGLGLLRVLLGRRRGAVGRLLLRVAGSWLAAAALLTGALELSRRMG